MVCLQNEDQDISSCNLALVQLMLETVPRMRTATIKREIGSSQHTVKVGSMLCLDRLFASSMSAGPYSSATHVIIPKDKYHLCPPMQHAEEQRLLEYPFKVCI